jgi:hypothetical protein
MAHLDDKDRELNHELVNWRQINSTRHRLCDLAFNWELRTIMSTAENNLLNNDQTREEDLLRTRESFLYQQPLEPKKLDKIISLVQAGTTADAQKARLMLIDSIRELAIRRATDHIIAHGKPKEQWKVDAFTIS